jgi:hypothetical protein
MLGLRSEPEIDGIQISTLKPTNQNGAFRSAAFRRQFPSIQYLSNNGGIKMEFTAALHIAAQTVKTRSTRLRYWKLQHSSGMVRDG